MDTRDLTQYFCLFLLISGSFSLFPSRWLELITARFSSVILNILGFHSEAGSRGSLAYLTLSGERLVRVFIVRECTGIHVWGIISALIIPLKYGGWMRKILSLILGALLVGGLNISRILLTVYLTAFDVPPLSWFLRSPTVETYHYPISFIYGVLGIMIVLLTIDRLVLKELGSFLAGLPKLLFGLLNDFITF